MRQQEEGISDKGKGNYVEKGGTGREEEEGNNAV